MNMTNQYKILALDLDGTLLDAQSRITPENARAVRMAQQAGGANPATFYQNTPEPPMPGAAPRQQAQAPSPASATGGWQCPSCGAQNSGNFCANCGTKRPAQQSGKWVCSCGSENEGKFCPNCGAKRPE